MNLLERFKNFTIGTSRRILISSILIALLIPATLFAATQRWELRKEAAETPTLIRTVIDKIRPVDSELASTLETYLNQQPEILDATHQIMSADLSLLDNPDVGSNCAIDPNVSCHSAPTLPSGSGTFDCGMPNHYPTLVNNIFAKFNQDNWSEDGNWIGDWQAVNDATAFAPSVLYQCAIGTDSNNVAELNRRANQTIDYEVGLIDEVIQDLLNGIYDYEKIGMTVGGQNSLVAARLYYPSSEPNAQKVQVYSRALAIGPALALIYDPSLAEKSPFSPVSALGYLAHYNFSLAEITQEQLEKRLYILLGRYLVQNNMESYWKEDNYGGYYKSMDSHGDIIVNGPLAFEQGLPLSAWAKLFKFDPNSRSIISQRLPLAITTHDNLFKNNAFVETVEGEAGDNVKFLSSNLLISRGLTYISEALRSSSDSLHQTIATHAKNRAMDVLTFINNNFYDSVGRYLDHHLINDSIKSGRYCTGCNFQALDNINLLWKIYNPPQYFTITVPNIYDPDGYETFCMYTTNPLTMSLAVDNSNGLNALHPHGLLVRGDGGFNQPWDWHLDPADVEMVEVSIRGCEAYPSDINESWFHPAHPSGGYYCPWSGLVTALTCEDPTPPCGPWNPGSCGNWCRGEDCSSDERCYTRSCISRPNWRLPEAKCQYDANCTSSPDCVPGKENPNLPGDLDCDCDVDIVDIMMVCAIWNTRLGDGDFRPEFDFDDDGDIDIVDIMYVAAKWNTRCPE